MEQFFKEHQYTLIFFGVLVGALTLLLAYYIHKKFGKNHINTNQIDHVCNLIEVLNTAHIEVGFAEYYQGGGIGSHGVALVLNIFEIGSYDSIDNGANQEYDAEPIYFSRACNQLIATKKYIDNPLTPRRIADQLLVFHNSGCRILTVLEADESVNNFVLISSGILEPNVTLDPDKLGPLVAGNCAACLTWLNLKEHSNTLKRTIVDWLIANGIEENNIRADFKTFR